MRLQNAYGTFRRELVPGWAAALTASHGTNQAITVVSAGSASSIDLTSAGISLERNVGKSLGLRLGYSHDFQERVGSARLTPGILQTLDAHRNRFLCDAFVSVGQTFRNVIMEEELQESGEPLDFAEIKGIVRRRRWQFLVPFFCGWVLVWGASWLIPSTYRSGTLILVEQPSVPEKYVVSNIDSDIQHQLDSITQQILSRTRLLRIIDSLGLYA